MNPSDKYKWELVPYYNYSSDVKSSFSAKHLYGKFLTYTDNNDFIGADLAKKMLERGSQQNDEFTSRYAEACSNSSFLFLEDKFFNTSE
jgi:hypothetical protein